MKNKANLLAAAAAMLIAGSVQAEEYAVYESDSRFEDVVDAVKLAIQDRGMYINNVMHMSDMLERTGKDLGMNEPIYGQAESIEFCSALLSRKMTAEDPRRIVNCPFIVSVYTLPDHAGTTYVAHRVIPAAETEKSAVMKQVADTLEGVAESAASW